MLSVQVLGQSMGWPHTRLYLHRTPPMIAAHSFIQTFKMRHWLLKRMRSCMHMEQHPFFPSVVSPSQEMPSPRTILLLRPEHGFLRYFCSDYVKICCFVAFRSPVFVRSLLHGLVCCAQRCQRLACERSTTVN